MFKITKISLVILLALGLQVTPVYAVNFGLFGDITYKTTDEAGSNDSFALGGLDFYATHQISDTTRVFVEYVFENTDDGLVTDLERLWISHTFKDELILAAGRFHTPLGSWNRTFHHGAILQDTVSRPFFLDFEDGAAGILPTHIVGLMASGDFTLATSEISYEFGLANGPSLNTSAGGFSPTADNKPEIEINATSNPSGSSAIIFRAIYKPDDIPVKAGLFVMDNDVAESNGTASAVTAKGELITQQTIYGVDFSYDNDSIDILAEYYNIDNTNKATGTSGSYTGKAYYIQLGYRFTETLKGVVRYEDLSFNANDNYFRALGTAEASHNVIGLRYDVDDTNALKIEYNEADLKTGIDTSTVTVQWSFLVP